MNALAERLKTACDLFETGVQLRRQALRRQFPNESDAAIEQRVNQWLAERPGAEFGDGPQPERD